MSSPVAETFRQAAKLNAEDPRRNGNVVRLESGCEVVLTGDIHGNRIGLARTIDYADLSQTQRRLILQEIIHGPLDERTGQDRSVELLLRAARLTITHPQQVLFILGNHDVAEITGNEILKDGRGYCKSFDAGARFAFGDDAAEILPAVREFLLSMPLAVCCPNGVFIAHSLPAPGRLEAAPTEILDRPYTDADLRRGGAVYEWTWGRGQTDEQVDALAGRLGVEFFLLGHRHTATGCEKIARRAATIASDHAHGCIVHFSCDEPLTAENVAEHTRTLAALGT